MTFQPVQLSQASFLQICHLLIPCPFMGPKTCCAKKWYIAPVTIFFVPDRKNVFYILSLVFVPFGGELKFNLIFGLTQNIMGPVEGQGISRFLADFEAKRLFQI